MVVSLAEIMSMLSGRPKNGAEMNLTQTSLPLQRGLFSLLTRHVQPTLDNALADNG